MYEPDEFFGFLRRGMVSNVRDGFLMTGGFPTTDCRTFFCSECSGWRTFAPTGGVPVKSGGCWWNEFYCGRCWSVRSVICDPPPPERTSEEIRDSADRQQILAGFNAARDGQDTPDGAGRFWLMGFFEYVRLQVADRAERNRVRQQTSGLSAEG